MIQELTQEVEALATKVIPADFLPTFLALPLESQLAGIRMFAYMGQETAVFEFAQKALDYIKEVEV